MFNFKKIKVEEPELITDEKEIWYCNEILPRESKITALEQENIKLQKENADLREKVILLRASESMLELEKYYGERDKYKEVIEEVRELMKKTTRAEGLYNKYNYQEVVSRTIEILDKVKE